MKIAILGAGKVGGALGKKWSNAGHTIRFGVRDTHKPQVQELVQSLGANVSATSIAEAIDFGDVVLFAITGLGICRIRRCNSSTFRRGTPSSPT